MSDLKKLQLIFQTLSDYNRLGIIKFICENECSVGEIVKAIKLSQPLVSHHLKVLKESGILETKRNGPFIYYYISDKRILSIDRYNYVRNAFTGQGNEGWTAEAMSKVVDL